MSTNSQLTIKTIRQLRSRNERLRTGLFYAEGNKVVAQAAHFGASIELGMVAPSLVTSDLARATIDILRERDVPIRELTTKQFNALSFKHNPSGIGAVIHADVKSLNAVQPQGVQGLGWIVLDRVGNAGNLGAICRTCDAVGCSGILMLEDTVDPYHPDALRASMGAIFGLKLVRANFADFIQWKQKSELHVVGTSDQAGPTYREVSYKTPLLLLMGSERLGLSQEQQQICDQVVRIPMAGTCDSLNLAVATSIVLYEAFHQQGA